MKHYIYDCPHCKVVSNYTGEDIPSKPRECPDCKSVVGYWVEALTVDQILEERGKTHGAFQVNAMLSQQLKNTLRDSPNYLGFSNVQREALDAICGKLGRIGCGNLNEPDHWDDIAGYATLVSKELAREAESFLGPLEKIINRPNLDGLTAFGKKHDDS